MNGKKTGGIIKKVLKIKKIFKKTVARRRIKWIPLSRQIFN